MSDLRAALERYIEGPDEHWHTVVSDITAMLGDDAYQSRHPAAPSPALTRAPRYELYDDHGNLIEEFGTLVDILAARDETASLNPKASMAMMVREDDMYALICDPSPTPSPALTREALALAVCTFHDHYHMTLAPGEGSCLNGQNEADAILAALAGDKAEAPE